MSTLATPLPQATTAEAVAERLRTAIVKGSLRPGDRLIEQDLAAAFDISRGPVREAIRLLGTEGLVELRRNRGAVVRTPTMDDVLEVYAIRMSLGGIAIAHAAETCASEGINLAEPERLIQRLRSARTQADPLAMVEADLAFQDAVVLLGGLPRICDAMQRTANDVRVFVRALGIRYDSDDYAGLIDGHAALLDAMAAGDADRAVEAWRAHVRRTVTEFTRAYDPAEIDDMFQRPHLRHVLDRQLA